MKRNFQTGVTLVVCAVLLMLTGAIVRQQIADSSWQQEGGNAANSAVCRLPSAVFPAATPAVCGLPSVVSFITGPPVAEVGELCVFNLNDTSVRADWTVIRQTDQESPVSFYIDSSGSALTFSSNIPAKYTIVAAIVEDGKPKILQHVCLYGVTPSPDPSPGPDPTPPPGPTPEPKPEPTTLAEWVRQNIPSAGREQSAVLASIYETTAESIERGTIRTQAAAFSSIRANTQAKIKPGTWEKFLDDLSGQIQTKLNGNTEIRPLGTLFREIADGLKVRPEISVPLGAICPDPTGADCQQVPTTTIWRPR